MLINSHGKSSRNTVKSYFFNKKLYLLLTGLPLYPTFAKENITDKNLSSEKIIVKGKHIANGQAAEYRAKTMDLGPLGDMKVEDAPFSIMGVSHDVIVNQQARNVNDLMRYLPSVQLEMRGNSATSRPQSRGFESEVVANNRMDGLNIVGTTPYPTEMFDNLQVLNGLAGALYGPQNPAGIFEYKLKRPTDRRMENFAFGIDSSGVVMEHADLGGRTGKNGWFGYRLNLLHGDGTSFVDQSWVRRNLVSGDFDIHLSEHAVIELDASHYTYDERGTPGGFSYNNSIQLPSAPDLSQVGYGQRYSGFNTETNSYLAKFKYQFSPKWHLNIGGGYQDALRNFFQNANSLLNSDGLYRQTISASSAANDFQVGSNFAYINGSVDTGFLTHDLTLGTNGYIRGNYNPLKTESFTLGQAYLDHPQSFAGYQPRSSGRYQSNLSETQSLIAGDTIHLDKHWAIMGTLSWSWMSNTNWNKTGTKTSSQSQDAVFSPMTSLIYHPFEGHTAYFTWGRSIQEGSIAPATGVNNPNEVMAPYRSEEYEVGYKVKIHQLLLNVAAFRITRPFAFIDPVTSNFGVGGLQRNYGVEFQAQGYITKDISVLGGVTWLDAQLGQTGNQATSHKQIVGVPPVQANILLDYRLPLPESNPVHGLALNTSFHYTGRRAANNYNTTFAAGYFTLDLGMRYPFKLWNKPLVTRFTVNNVTNERYWASLYPSSIDGGTGNNSAYAGLPRTFQFNVEVNF